MCSSFLFLKFDIYFEVYIIYEKYIKKEKLEGEDFEEGSGAIRNDRLVVEVHLYDC